MWKITKDNVDNGLSVGRTSSDFNETKWNEQKKNGEVTKFRLLDDDGEIYFYGEYDGLNGSETKAFAPLDQWGAAFGCTELQFRNEEGEYETL
jgi:hypothetical protein